MKTKEYFLTILYNKAFQPLYALNAYSRISIPSIMANNAACPGAILQPCT